MHELACYGHCLNYLKRNPNMIGFYNEYGRGDDEKKKIDKDEWNKKQKKQKKQLNERRHCVDWFDQARLIISKLIMNKKEKLVKLLPKYDKDNEKGLLGKELRLCLSKEIDDDNIEQDWFYNYAFHLTERLFYFCLYPSDRYDSDVDIIWRYLTKLCCLKQIKCSNIDVLLSSSSSLAEEMKQNGFGDQLTASKRRLKRIFRVKDEKWERKRKRRKENISDFNFESWEKKRKKTIFPQI